MTDMPGDTDYIGPERRQVDGRILAEVEAMARQTARLAAILDGRPDEGQKGLRAAMEELRQEVREYRKEAQAENAILRAQIGAETKARETVQNKLDGVLLAARFAAVVLGAGSIVGGANFIAGIFGR